MLSSVAAFFLAMYSFSASSIAAPPEGSTPAPRGARSPPMLDLRYVVDHLDEVQAGLSRRSAAAAETLAPIAVLGKKRRELIGAVEGAAGTGQGEPLWAVREPKGKAFVDFQNDVGLKDLKLANAEGYGHVELAKRYTTNGMATDQGKLSNVNAIGILAEARGVSPACPRTAANSEVSSSSTPGCRGSARCCRRPARSSWRPARASTCASRPGTGSGSTIRRFAPASTRPAIIAATRHLTGNAPPRFRTA